MSKVSAIKL